MHAATRKLLGDRLARSNTSSSSEGTRRASAGRWNCWSAGCFKGLAKRRASAPLQHLIITSSQPHHLIISTRWRQHSRRCLQAGSRGSAPQNRCREQCGRHRFGGLERVGGIPRREAGPARGACRGAGSAAASRELSLARAVRLLDQACLGSSSLASVAQAEPSPRHGQADVRFASFEARPWARYWEINF